MHYFLFGAAFAAPLVAFANPLFGIFHPRSGPNSSDTRKHPHSKRRRNTDHFCGRKQWAADEFAFERAIQAYEELIDATARGLK